MGSRDVGYREERAGSGWVGQARALPSAAPPSTGGAQPPTGSWGGTWQCPGHAGRRGQTSGGWTAAALCPSLTGGHGPQFCQPLSAMSVEGRGRSVPSRPAPPQGWAPQGGGPGGPQTLRLLLQPSLRERKSDLGPHPELPGARWAAGTEQPRPPAGERPEECSRGVRPSGEVLRGEAARAGFPLQRKALEGMVATWAAAVPGLVQAAGSAGPSSPRHQGHGSGPWLSLL